MPSLFEAGAIIQHKFFIVCTLVNAFRDTFFAFRQDNNSGNGLTFDYYNGTDLFSSMQRALDLFKNREKYEIFRKNAFNSSIYVADISRAFCQEFYRFINKIYFNEKFLKNSLVNNSYNFNPEEGRMNLLSDYQNRASSNL